MSLASTELQLFIDNTRALWKAKQTVWARLARRKARGEYDSESGARSFGTVVNAGAKAYVRELGLCETWSTAFPTADRLTVAKAFEREFRRRYKLGELDYLLPAKLRPKRRPRVAERGALPGYMTIAKMRATAPRATKRTTKKKTQKKSARKRTRSKLQRRRAR